MPERSFLPRVLRELGISKSLQRIKFGGVVGKQSVLGIVTAVALAAMAFKADPKVVIYMAILAVAVVALIAVLNFVYATKHPAEAMLEGTEMLALQQQVLASKFYEPPKEAPVIPDPQGRIPQLNPAEGPDE